MMNKNQLGIIEDWSEKGFKHTHDLGLTKIEFCYNIGNDPKDLLANLDNLKMWQDKYQVALGAMGRWGSDKIDESGYVIEDEFKNNCTLIDIASELGCTVFNTGVNFVKDYSYDKNCEFAVKYLRRITEYGKEKGVRVALYNCDWNNFANQPKAWEKIIPEVDGLGIKFDPTHPINERQADFIQEMIDWGKYFYHFHIKGTIQHGKNHVDDPPAGLDMINWHEVIGLLYWMGYDGMLSLEPHSAVWKNGELGEWGIRHSIKYIENMLLE